jgi:IS30 family transposase
MPRARQCAPPPASTISRELVRNTGARGYRFKQAREKASQRRQEASDKPRKITPDLVELIEEKLTQEQWSPDQISGRLAKDGVAFISHERGGPLGAVAVLNPAFAAAMAGALV